VSGSATGRSLPPRHWLPLLLLVLLGLPGCTPVNWIAGETLYVMAVTQRRLDWLRRDVMEERLWAPLIDGYSRLHPQVRLSLSTVNEDQVEEELRRRTSRGLGPDLILVRAPMANTLLKAGLIASPPDTPAMRRGIAQVAPRYLERVRLGAALSGLPLHELVTLACFNRARVPDPPRTTTDLLALAASGRAVGLSIDPYGIWWTAGTEDADKAIVPIVTGEPPASPAEMERWEEEISGWLAWLRQAAQQNKVDIASGPEELTEALIQSRLDWIPCFSLTLDLLGRKMGDRLGVSALPSGPGGDPSPFNTLMVWSFGLDSSPAQRRNAADLAALSVDPLIQRRYVLDSLEVLAVNKMVETPVASSGVLAALEEAQRQFASGSPMLGHPFTVEHLKRVVRPLENVLQQVMAGVLTPQEGTREILQLRGLAR
jgi:arabinogalactan oligomer/maltooligosaccharide transport system substrate-binding protein